MLALELRSRSRPGGLDMLVPPRPELVAAVRHALDALDLPEAVLDDARLLLSELITNSVRHAGLSARDLIRVRIRMTGARLRVEVRDRPRTNGDTAPVAGAIRPRPEAESGWGLYLIERLSSRWGASPGRYWFELEV